MENVDKRKSRTIFHLICVGHTRAAMRTMLERYRAAGVQMPPLEPQASPAGPGPRAAPAKARPSAGKDAIDAIHVLQPDVRAVT